MKFNAFTLIELSVAMIITAVALSSAFLVISSLEKDIKSWIDFVRTSHDRKEVLTQLNNDVFHCKDLKLIEDTLLVQFDSGLVRYEFGEDLIRTHSSRRDTFQLEVQVVDFNSVNTILIDTLDFVVNGSYRKRYTKRYAYLDLHN